MLQSAIEDTYVGRSGGPWQANLPHNNRLKQTARGRSGAESLRRTRAAA